MFFFKHYGTLSNELGKIKIFPIRLFEFLQVVTKNSLQTTLSRAPIRDFVYQLERLSLTMKVKSVRAGE